MGKTNDEDFINVALLYVGPSVGELWIKLPAVKATPYNWADFKTQYFAYYPKSNVTSHYSPVYLQQVV